MTRVVLQMSATLDGCVAGPVSEGDRGLPEAHPDIRGGDRVAVAGRGPHHGTG
jgi:hypothetical protein